MVAMDTQTMSIRLPRDVYENLRSEAFVTRRPMNEIITESVAARYHGRGKAVHHIDGDPLNNDPANLVLMDPKENRP
jgi:hypothetical protein